ncbi:MAG: DNA-binding protein [Huintestinicola sp.]
MKHNHSEEKNNNELSILMVKLIRETILSEMSELKKQNELLKPNSNLNNESQIELITIRDCTKLIPGISYYTIRQLAEQKKIKSFRTGQGKHGKILIFKDSFLSYFKGEIA